MIPRPAIESFIERAYSVDRLTQRIERHFFLVAEARGEIIAFAEALLDGDHVNLAAIYAHPARRGQRAGSLLLAGVRDHFRGLSVAADVVDGNRKGEAFYEARGFIPGLTFRTELLGEAVAERRWWLKPE